MPVQDPNGKTGPSFDNFLLFESVVDQKICPYRKKCTYGSKCKFYHPERSSKKPFITAHESVIGEAQENIRFIEAYKETIKLKETDELIVELNIEEKKCSNIITQLSNISNEKQKEILKQKTILNIEKSFDFKKFIVPTSDIHLVTRGMSNNIPQINAINKVKTANQQQQQQQPECNSIDKCVNSKAANSCVNMQKTIIIIPVDPREALLKKLIKRISENKARQILLEYPDETDEDKLVYFSKQEDSDDF
jgi:hypothetical protein